MEQMTARPPRASERKVLMRRAAVVESRPDAAKRDTKDTREQIVRTVRKKEGRNRAVGGCFTRY